MTEFIVCDTGVRRYLSKLAFRRLFTIEERINLDNISASIPLDNAELEASLTTQQKGTVRVLQNDMNIATYIDLDNPDTISGVSYLESIGLLAAGRAAEILSTVVTQQI